MPVPDTIPVLDLKPLQYNPFSDGTVVYDSAGGVLVPRSASSMVDPIGENPLLQNRPSNASTQGLIDSAKNLGKSGVKANAAALRGYQTAGDFFDTGSFGRALDNLSDAELNGFINDLKTQGARTAAEAAATVPRQTAQQALRRGSQFAGALGTAIDAYNLADAVLDPTNNPADEIGDIAGSMLGGALGSSLGPIGALGGSLVGGWLGRQLGNLLQGDEGRTRSNISETPPFTGGQMPGVLYRVVADALVNGPAISGYPQYGEGIGPISGFEYEHTSEQNSSGNTYYSGNVKLRDGDGYVQFSGWVGTYEALAGYSGFSSQQTINAEVIEITRKDGQPDTGGNPPGKLIPIVTPPTYAPAPTMPTGEPLPAPTGEPLPAPTGEPLPAPKGEPLPAPTGKPLPAPTGEPLPAPIGGPGLDDPTWPDNLPDPIPNDSDDSAPINPNPNPDCCQINGININRLLYEVEQIKQQFETTGNGYINMPSCDSQTPYLMAWNGSGFQGIYSALEQFSEATTRMWEMIKCPPKTIAALPMAWEAKVQEHEQLIVLWGPSDGGKNRWSMHIPHPKKTINKDYRFAFPAYRKGKTTGRLVLSDNTMLIINGASKAECIRVMNYCKQLIDNSYLKNSREIFSESSSNNNQIVDIKATYIKAFNGHRTNTPRWAKSLVE